MPRLDRVTVYLTAEEATMIVEALKYKAKMEAGMTQMPDLMQREDYEEWAFAERIEQALLV